MLAARLNVKTLTLSMDDVPIPEPGPGQVRVKVRAADVCLSEVRLIDGSVRPLHLRQDEVTLGHEIAGTVNAVEPGVTSYQVGQRALFILGGLGAIAFGVSLFARPGMGTIALALQFGMFSLTNGAGLIMQGIGLRKNRQTRPSVVPHRKAA